MLSPACVAVARALSTPAAVRASAVAGLPANGGSPAGPSPSSRMLQPADASVATIRPPIRNRFICYLLLFTATNEPHPKRLRSFRLSRRLADAEPLQPGSFDILGGIDIAQVDQDRLAHGRGQAV